MDKLLSEEEYSALLADRERLEWMECHCGEWDGMGLAWFDHYTHSFSANNLREAIDKARGVVK